MSFMQSSGWCAPSETIYDVVFVEPELWPPGLTAEDVDWITRMLVAGEIEVTSTRWPHLDLPEIGIRRGGITWDLNTDST